MESMTDYARYFVPSSYAVCNAAKKSIDIALNSDDGNDREAPREGAGRTVGKSAHYHVDKDSHEQQTEKQSGGN